MVGRCVWGREERDRVTEEGGGRQLLYTGEVPACWVRPIHYRKC